jgi:hypothetical protein
MDRLTLQAPIRDSATDDPSAPFRIVAIIAAFNEGDIIGAVLEHLIENDVDAYLIDNRSTDDTVEQARRWLGRGLIDIETFPAEKGRSETSIFSWRQILERKIAIARDLPADWCIHHDADEFRESPWPAITLRDAIKWVDQLGYSAIDFRLLNFPPVDDGFEAGMNPKTYFTRCEEGAEYDRIQIKSWKRSALNATLTDGGHEVKFSGRRVFPVRFILRHYPIRGQTQGMRKVLTERQGRFAESERSLGWHVQYDLVHGEDHSFLRNPASLRPFELEEARLEAQLEAQSGDLRACHEPPVAEDGGYEGFLDRVCPDAIVGWAWGGVEHQEPISVDLWDGDRFLAKVLAHQSRPDLRRAGKGDGRSGFVFPTPSELLDGRRHWIWANVAGTSIALKNSPLSMSAERHQSPCM